MQRHDPVRSCVGCRARRSADALVRITDGPTIDGPSDGRGAWLCRGDEGVDRACLDRALRGGGFARAWRRAVGDTEAANLRRLLDEWRPTASEPTDRAPGEGLTTGKG